MTTACQWTDVNLSPGRNWMSRQNSAHTHLLQLQDTQTKPNRTVVVFLLQGETLARKSTSSCHSGATLTASFWIQRLRPFLMSTIRPSAFSKYQGKHARTYTHPTAIQCAPSINYWFNSHTNSANNSAPSDWVEGDRNRSMGHSIQTHTQNSQCRINGEESEPYKMQPRGTRVSGGLPTLSFSRRVPLSLYRRPHTQSDPADGGLSMLVAFHAKPLAQKLDQKSIEIVILMTARVHGGYWHCCALQ